MAIVKTSLASGGVSEVHSFRYTIGGVSRAYIEIFQAPDSTYRVESKIVAENYIIHFPDYFYSVEEALGYVVPQIEEFIYKKDIWARDFERKTVENELVQLIKKINPGPEEKGEPFWVLLCLDENEQLNGKFYTQIVHEKVVIPLFLSQEQAEQAKPPFSVEKLVVRGLNKAKLKELVFFWEKLNARSRPSVAVANTVASDDMGTVFEVSVPEDLDSFRRILEDIFEK